MNVTKFNETYMKKSKVYMRFIMYEIFFWLRHILGVMGEIFISGLTHSTQTKQSTLQCHFMKYPKISL